ncbi:MAG: hypothetical protein PWQ35_105 [Patescibacteria group bacterium]|nr:hypothetical protein [Patescibacteria group bacterium]
MRKKTLAFIEIALIIIFIFILLLFSLWLLEQGKIRANDAKKIADVKEIQSALALYFHENNDYPDILESNNALQSRTTIYLDIVPEAPISKGECASFGYNYQRNIEQEGNPSYTLEYCLSQASADIPAGINTATPAGLSLRKID